MMKTVFTFLAILLAATTAFAQTPKLFVVEENGPRADQINIVYLSEGYTTSSMPNFAGHVRASMDYLFTKEPWKQYRSYCNVYRIEIASAQNGTDNGTIGGPRNTYFNSGFYLSSVPQLLSLGGNGDSKVYSLLNNYVPEYDIPVVMVNETKFGGSGGSISVASVHSSSNGIVEHEIGHSFAGLVDEYDIDYPYATIEAPNNTAVTNPALIKWKAWIAPGTPIPTPETSQNDAKVGLFEGSMYKTRGWYRPHNNSLMKSLFRPPGDVNRQEFVLSFYRRVGTILSSAPVGSIPTVVGPKDLTFSVTPRVPSEGLPMEVAWKLDGNVLPSRDTPTLDIISDLLGDGVHTVTAVVKDPTPFVRSDPSSLLVDQKSWVVSLTGQLPKDLAGWRTRFGPDNSNPTGDGLENLIKYALGLDPTKKVVASDHVSAAISKTTGASAFSTTDPEYLTLTIPRRTRRTDVDYIVEVCSDFDDWRSGPGHTVTLTDTEKLLVVRDAVPIGPGVKRFIRLKVAVK